jgi:lysophospholipase L1-like esterase
MKLDILRSNVRKIVTNISISLLSLLLCVVFLELVIRMFSLDRAIEGELHNSKENVAYGNRIKVQDPDIGWFLSGYDFSGEKLVINFKRPRIFYKKKGNNKFRIFVLGDSIAEVWTSWNPDSKFPQMLETSLNNSISKNKYEVINVSVGSYNTAQRLAILKKWFYDWEFDLLIIQHTLNDDEGNPIYQKSEGNKDIYIYYSCNILGLKYFEGNPLLNSALFRFINLKLYNAEHLKCPKKFGIIGHYPDRQREYYRWFREYCRSKGIKLFVIIFPYLTEYSDYQFHSQHNKINNLLDELKIPHYDLYDDYKEVGPQYLQIHPKGFVHPNFEGHKIATLRLKEQLINNNFLD